ncbi:hypothetical protein [Thalassotalea castellviae]|uniref:Flagellar protein FlgN n=1 Tax=Thalassotalea castellviae TaxID=3075612 RepID=A0ABU3A4J3_9GAMM|nr:hypothetical protein [Thalassotalea sp. W431]MDT0605097.1 hypothetical protein [Thalassotalea sp. W431]
MRNLDSTNVSYGDLALIEEIAQTYTEEIKNLLSLQYNLKTNQVGLDFHEEIDMRLLSISRLNHLIAMQSASSLQTYSPLKSSDYQLAGMTLLNELQQLCKHAKQNIELINSLERFIESKSLKRHVEQYTNEIKNSLQVIQKKESALTEYLAEQKKSL